MTNLTEISRRWVYCGVEYHHGGKYYMWEHAVTGQRYARYAPYYVLETTGSRAEM